MLHTHEVTGSSPVVSTRNRKAPPFGWCFSVSGGARDSNPSKCKMPVASCGHQFENWWQPYDLPVANRPSIPVDPSIDGIEGRQHVLHCRNNGRRGSPFQRNRRERPVCRSAPERTELFPIIPNTFPRFCHSDREAEWRNLPRWVKEPTQDKNCCLGRFLGSFHSLGMTWWGWFRFARTGCIRYGAWR